MTSVDTLQILMTKIAEFERANGRAPTISEIAKALDKSPSEIRHIIRTVMGSGETDGTSACSSSLRQLLLGARTQKRISLNGVVTHNLIRLLDQNGLDLGILSTELAHIVAKEKELFLCIINPLTSPPVARLMEYGEYIFHSKRREKAIRRKLQDAVTKELKIKNGIAAHDYRIKIHQAQNFLQKGNHISVTVSLSNRESVHVAPAFELLNRFALDLDKFSEISAEPSLEGLCAMMMLTPLR